MGRCLWDVDQAVNQLERIIREHLNRCMPLRTVSMSPRDPVWMTPLVKCMLRAKSRSEDSWKALNKRISEVIVENRRNFLASKGSCERWKRVDSISQRCRSMVLSLDHASLEELNDYFGELCSENTYMAPVFCILCGRTTPNSSPQSLPWFGIFLSRLTRGLDLEKSQMSSPYQKWIH